MCQHIYFDTDSIQLLAWKYILAGESYAQRYEKKYTKFHWVSNFLKLK